MFGDFELDTLIIVVAAAIVGHIVLVLLASYVNPLSIIAGLYFPLASFSAAEEIPGFNLFKFGRIYSTVLIILAGVFIMRGLKFGWASGMYLAFTFLFVMAGVYHDMPIDALQFKGLLMFVMVAGMVLVGTFKSPDDIRFFIRVSAVASGLFALVIGALVAQRPTMLFQAERLTLLGMNANRIGLELAAAFILNIMVVLHDKSKLLRLYCVGVSMICAGVTLATGSRGAAGILLIGFLLVVTPVVRRPILLAVSLVASYGLVSVVVTLINPRAADRLGQLNFDTRAGVWGEAFDRWVESPVIGHGWAARYTPGGRLTGVNYHSMFYQLLVETGIIGALLFFIALAVVAFVMFRTFVSTRHADRESRAMVYFAIALVMTPLMHGVAENAALQGSSAMPFFLAVGLCLIDRLPAILGHPQELRGELADYDGQYADEEAYGEPASG